MNSAEQRMIDRVTLIVAAALLSVLFAQTTSADEAADQKAAAERQKQFREELERKQLAEQAALKVRRFRFDAVIDEPQEVFVDEDYGDILPEVPSAPELASVIFENSVFGSQGSREDFVRRLEKILKWKVDSLDLNCKLSDAQRMKLTMAGRGDIKHLFDRIDDSRRHFVDVDVGPAGRLFPNQLHITVRGLQSQLSSGPFDDNSLFARIMQRTLTVEQDGSLVALTEIERLGGRVTKRTQRGEVVSDAFLTATGLTDDGLAKTKRLPHLRLLALEITRVTDAGLVHVAGLKGLEVLDLCGTRITGAGLVNLKDLPNLKILMLRNTSVNDASLAHLAGLANLKELQLQGTRVTDAGLLHLVPLRQLELLNLGRTRVTDAGLVNLDLPSRAGLRELGFAHTEITDAGLALVRGLTGLERLYLNGTQITDTGLAELAGLTRLEQLYLDDTPITDGGLEHLKGLTQLQRLDLSGTRVGDTGLAHIYGLKNLEYLDLANTLVTNERVDELRRELPKVVVIR